MSSGDQSAYPEVDRSLGQLSFQLSCCYNKKDAITPYQSRNRIDLSQIEYDFSLEHEIKKVFDTFDQREDDEKDEELVEDEEPVEKEIMEKPPRPERPPVPKRGFEVSDQKENDSGVSSGGETNPIDVLQPVQTNPRPIYQRQPSKKDGSSVLDIFDVSRNDDPFEVAQLNSLDEKKLLAQVFEPEPTNNNNMEVIKDEEEKKLTKSPKPPKPSVASSLQSVLAQRQVQRQMYKTQNFNKSAMAALNSLPVISSSTPVATTPPPAPAVRSVFPAECEQFGEQLVLMGYEKLIVLKSIQLFGTDEHKCIDFLSAHSDLQSETSITSSEIIKALTVCEFSKDETRLFLQKSKRYLEMGFDHKAVRNALIRYPNEPQYVLESLMTHNSK